MDFELDGKMQKLPMPALINLRSHPDETMRRRGYEAENAAWESVKESLAACLNGVKGEANTLNKRRGRKDALHSALDAARIDRKTLEAMLEAMQASFPMFRRYFKAKAQKLGKEKLAWWDIFAPLGKTDKVYSFEEARDFHPGNFGKFSPDLQAFARRAFDNRWIDAEQREGKRGGAFCMGVAGVKESRVLCNFDGSFDQVSTIAHELGHGFHNECAYAAGKTELQQLTPMTLAETASTMCETIVTEAVLAATKDPQEELAVLEAQIQGAGQVIVDIYSRYLFEKEVFERREQGRALRRRFLRDHGARAEGHLRRRPGRALSAEVHVDLEAALLFAGPVVLQLPLCLWAAVRHRPVRHLPAARAGVRGGLQACLPPPAKPPRPTWPSASASTSASASSGMTAWRSSASRSTASARSSGRPWRPGVTRWSGSAAPTEKALRLLLEGEGLQPYSWANGPFDLYAAHGHDYDKVIYVVRGSITFGLPERARVWSLRQATGLTCPPGRCTMRWWATRASSAWKRTPSDTGLSGYQRINENLRGNGPGGFISVLPQSEVITRPTTSRAAPSP